MMLLFCNFHLVLPSDYLTRCRRYCCYYPRPPPPPPWLFYIVVECLCDYDGKLLYNMCHPFEKLLRVVRSLHFPHSAIIWNL